VTWLANPETWLALATLTTLEIVLGVDNIVMLVVLTGRLPAEQQPFARRIGLLVALGLASPSCCRSPGCSASRRPWSRLPVSSSPATISF
jgi:hypothetical protein